MRAFTLGAMWERACAAELEAEMEARLELLGKGRLMATDDGVETTETTETSRGSMAMAREKERGRQKRKSQARVSRGLPTVAAVSDGRRYRNSAVQREIYAPPERGRQQDHQGRNQDQGQHEAWRAWMAVSAMEARGLVEMPERWDLGNTAARASGGGVGSHGYITHAQEQGQEQGHVQEQGIYGAAEEDNGPGRASILLPPPVPRPGGRVVEYEEDYIYSGGGGGGGRRVGREAGGAVD